MKALGLLLALGIADLVATAVLHAHGLIEERNPLMAPLLARGEGAFIVAKGLTLIFGGVVLARQARHHRGTVRRACLVGSGAYALLLGLAFFGR